MEVASLAGQQGPFDRLAQERVPGADPAGVVDPQQAGVDRRTERLAQLLGRHAERRLQQPLLDRRPGHGDRAHDAFDRRRQRRDPSEQDVDQRGRHDVRHRRPARGSRGPGFPGTGAGAASPAASSSSTKNGFPSDRRQIARTLCSSTARPVIAATWCPTSPSSSRSRSTRSAAGLRRSSAIHGITGCDRATPSDRSVTTSSSRSASRLCTRNVRRSRVAGSLQWMSSMPTSSGRWAASRWRSPRIASNSRARRRGLAEVRGSERRRRSRRPLPASPGTSAASSRRAGSSAASASGSPDRDRRRTISATGRNASGVSPSCMQAPVSTRPPAASMWPPNSRSSRDLPMPASPASSTTRGRPASTARQASRRRSSSTARSTRVGLEIASTTRIVVPSARVPVGVWRRQAGRSARLPAPDVTDVGPAARRCSAEGRVVGRSPRAHARQARRVASSTGGSGSSGGRRLRPLLGALLVGQDREPEAEGMHRVPPRARRSSDRAAHRLGDGTLAAIGELPDAPT